MKEEKQEPFEKDEFLAQIQREVQMSRNFVDLKRSLHRRNIEKYIDQTVDDEKVPINVAYATINLSIAIELSDERNPVFLPRGVGDDEIAENLTDVAKFDYSEMGLKKMQSALAWYNRVFGVSIITKTGWDEISVCPTIAIKDPLSWLPDPFFDETRPARFHYFEELIDKECVSEEYGFIEGAEEYAGSISSNESQNISSANMKSGYSDQSPDEAMISVINGYTYYEDKLYMVTTTDDASTLLRMVEVKPVFKVEKDKVPMSSVVNIKWFSPKTRDPYGVSLLEIIGPKQSALSQLVNLRLIDAKYSTLGQMFLYDINTVQNVGELAKATTNPKYIGVDGKNNPISQAVYPVPRQNILEDSFRVSQEIMESMQLETGIDSRQLGVQGAGDATLGEVKTIQENANLRFALTSHHSEKADEEFWRDIWYRSYKEFFSKTDKKFIRIASSIDGTRLLTLTRDDFLTFEDPSVYIESRRKFESERKGMAAQLEARLAIMEANPNTPTISLNYMRRKILKLQGFSRSDVQVIVPYTPEEMDARNTVKLLNVNDKDAAIVRNLNEDHMTYLVVFQSASDTDAKDLAIEMRKKAYIESGQSQKQEVGQGAGNTATNQMINSAIQQNASGQSIQ